MAIHRVQQPASDSSDEERLNQLVDYAMLLAQGQLDEELAVEGDDEIGVLVQCLTRLKEQLKEKRAVEAELVRNQWLVLTGSLLRCAAHDLNNILGALVNSGELLQQELGKSTSSTSIEQQKRVVESICSCTQRGRETLTQLMELAKIHERAPESVDLCQVVSQAHQLLTATCGKQYTIEAGEVPDSAMVRACPNQLLATVLTLCITVRQSLPRGGTIHLGIQARETDTHFNANVTAMLGAHFALSITGDGPSPTPTASVLIDNSGHLPIEAGIDLYTAQTMMSAIDGRIDVVAKVDKAVGFEVLVARADAPEQAPEVVPKRQGKRFRLARPGESILLIDDEEAIRTVTQMMLNKLGYGSHMAVNAAEGLALYKEHRAEISLVLLDLILPDSDGADVFAAITKLNPDAKILIMSGFTRDPRIADLLMRGCVGFLQKPYNMSELSEAMRDALS